jgi:hypothetical protein
MSAFGMYEIVVALALGLLIGVVVVASSNAQHKSSNAGALAALQQRMGSLYGICLFVAGAMPVVVIALLGTMRAAPTLLDSVVMILLIGLAMIASFTLFGNVMKMAEERGSSTPSP